MLKVNNRSNKRRSGDFIVNFEYILHISSVCVCVCVCAHVFCVFFCFAEFEHVNARWNTLLL